MEAVYYEHEQPNLKKRLAKALRHLDELKAIGCVDCSAARHALSVQTLHSEESSEYSPVLLHGDLSMQHILIDESGGTLTGIIDWSDAMLGDPCEDIAGVSLSLGATMARTVAMEAGYDEHTVERGLILAKCLAIQDLWDLKFANEEQPSETLLKAQFWLAFEGSDLGDLSHTSSQ